MMPPKGKNVVFSLLAIVLFSLGAAHTAKADILVSVGNNPQSDENVLLSGAVTGNPIFGLTNQTQLSVRFRGQEPLTAPANGQARIEAVDGSLNQLTTDLSSVAGGPPTGSFTSLIFNLNAEGNGTVNFTAIDTNGQQFLSAFALGAGGQNFFTFTTSGNTRISSVSFTTTVPVGLGLDDIRQVRIGGAQNNAVPTPEPATMLLLGTGLVGVAARIRKRRKA
ncbi:MAG: PEP-CTERM sorting domain-containing protein [Acidobacteria bacterium]|nr:PEP-CTERM sorting domain-containing protein [Acidobacteriota bacterium]